MVSSAESGQSDGAQERAKRLIAAARLQAEDDLPAPATPEPQLRGFDADGASSSLQVRCPHCQCAVSVAEDTSWSQIACCECGSSFSLIGGGPSLAMASTRLGRFELLERIGEGGFGTVWRALDTQLDRQVAIKVPRRDDLTASETELFLREARATAQLRHVHIVSLHEVGRDGRTLYLVSDLIDGQSLAERIRQRISINEAVDLCRRIAQALHYAHTMGVVHRDLKPANVLLNARGEPHLTDFGLAKRDAGEVTMTVDGQLVGTPSYMSPEQASGRSHEADARSDIYSLGVVLFEMLTGELPFRGNPRMVVDKVLHSDPPAPRSLNNQIPRDLETICLKCLEKQPAARYATAADLASDLVRLQRRERITARPAGALRRLSRWYRRHPAAGNLGAVVVAFAMVGPMFAWQQSRLVQRESQARARADRYLYVAHMNNVQDACETSDYGRALALLDQHQPQPGDDDLRSFEWYYWRAFCQRGLRSEIRTGDQINALAASPDGSLIAVGGTGSRIGLWDRTRAIRRFVLTGHTETVTGLDFTSDGRWLASCSQDKSVRLWDVATGKCADCLENLPAGVRGIAFSHDGRRLAAASLDGTALVFDLQAGESSDAQAHLQLARPVRQVLTIPPPTGSTDRPLCYSVAWNWAGTHLATGSGGPANWSPGEMQWWNLASGDCEARVATARPCDFLACSPRDDLMAFRDAHGSLMLWDPATLEFRHRLICPAGDVFCPVFSSGGARVAVLSDRGTIFSWDVSTEQIVESWPGHTTLVYAMAHLPAENLLVSGGFDGNVRIWQETPQSQESLTPAHHKGVVSLAFTPDGSRLLSGSRDGELRIWKVDNGDPVEALDEPSHWAGVIAMSPDGKTLAYCSDKQVVGFWNLGESRARAQLPPHREPVTCIAFSPDGKLLAAGGGVPQTLWPGAPTDLRIWQTETRQVYHQLQGNRRLVRCLAFSPDGQTLATGGFDRQVLLWDVSTGQQRRTIETRSVFNVMCLAFAPDSGTLAFGTHDGSIWLADLHGEAPLRKVTGRDGAVWAVAYSPDGKSLAAAFGQQVQGANERATIKLWDTATTELKLCLTSQSGPPQSLAFSPDGQVLASGFNDGSVHLWRAPRDGSR